MFTSPMPDLRNSSAYRPMPVRSEMATRPPRLRVRTISRTASRRPSRERMLWIAKCATAASKAQSSNGNLRMSPSYTLTRWVTPSSAAFLSVASRVVGLIDLRPQINTHGATLRPQHVLDLHRSSAPRAQLPECSECAACYRAVRRGRLCLTASLSIKLISYCGKPSTTYVRNFAYLSPIFRASRYSGALRDAFAFSRLS